MSDSASTLRAFVEKIEAGHKPYVEHGRICSLCDLLAPCDAARGAAAIKAMLDEMHGSPYSSEYMARVLDSGAAAWLGGE